MVRRTDVLRFVCVGNGDSQPPSEQVFHSLLMKILTRGIVYATPVTELIATLLRS
jgi:hypothetical protein